MGRELYDLCRKYKHFWKKVEDVKALDNKYHDLDLSSAFMMSQFQLAETEDEMLKQLFKEFGVICLNIESEIECFERPMWHLDSRFPTPNPRECGSSHVLDMKDSRRFIKCLAEYMSDWRRIRK